MKNLPVVVYLSVIYLMFVAWLVLAVVIGFENNDLAGTLVTFVVLYAWYSVTDAILLSIDKLSKCVSPSDVHVLCYLSLKRYAAKYYMAVFYKQPI